MDKPATMLMIVMIILAIESPLTNLEAPSMEPKKADSRSTSLRFSLACSLVMRPALKSASILICLPGIASKVNLADTSATRSAPFVITIKLTTVIMTKIITPTTILPPATNKPIASISSPASPCKRIDLVLEIFSDKRNIVVKSRKVGKLAKSKGLEI